MTEQLRMYDDPTLQLVFLQDVEAIEPSKNGYAELVKSVRNLGVQTPVILREVEDAEEPYKVVAGRRRIAAARECGFEKIAAMVYPASMPVELIPITTITENRVRSQNIANELESVLKLTDLGYDGEQIAKETGIPKGKVNEYMAMLDLGENIVQGITHGKIAITTAKELTKLRGGALARAEELFEKKGKLTGEDVHTIKSVQVSDAGKQVDLPEMSAFTLDDFMPTPGDMTVVVGNPESGRTHITAVDPMEIPAFVAMKADATERFERETSVKAILKGDDDAEIVRQLRKLYGVRKSRPRKSS